MRDGKQIRESADTATWTAHRRLRNAIATCRRSGGPAVLVASAAVALAVLSATASSRADSPGKRRGSGDSARSSKSFGRRPRSVTKLATDDSTRLLAQWTSCERGHGDSSQADPTVDHEVIYIEVRMGALPGWGANDTAAACGQYLAAARSAVAGGQPVDGWGDDALYVQYANCMRANGYPTFPYPSGIEPDGHESTNFNGTGIDPNSPAFLNGNANQNCGRQIGAPAWWINNWGPPGSVVVYPAGTNPNNPWPLMSPRPFAAKPITSLRPTSAPIDRGGWGGGSHSRPAVAAVTSLGLARGAKPF